MEVTIHGHNVKVNEQMTDYTQKKLGKLDRYLPNIKEIRVDISRQNTRRGADITAAQITLRHSRGAILRSEEKVRGDDGDALQSAINIAADKMYRQIERFKGKRQNKKRRGQDIYFATDEELDLAEDFPEFEDIEESEDISTEVEIIRRKVVSLIPMIEAEAIEQMELLDHNFFMFLNAETGEINILYRREAEGYGLLIPE
jgi:putative sigma-54 modulation protein